MKVLSVIKVQSTMLLEFTEEEAQIIHDFFGYDITTLFRENCSKSIEAEKLKALSSSLRSSTARFLGKVGDVKNAIDDRSRSTDD